VPLIDWRSFSQGIAMSPDEWNRRFKAYHQAVVAADDERRRQAYDLAEIELGPRPPASDSERWMDYIAALNDLASEKFRRLN
jgi:hypothetical protein